MASKDKGIMIFKETFEYMMEGMITEEQFGKLMKMVYQTRWEDGVDESTIEDKEIKLIWKTLKHVILKSKTNSNQYKKNTQIETNTAFETENDTLTPPAAETLPKGQELGKNKAFELDPIVDGEIDPDDCRYVENNTNKEIKKNKPTEEEILEMIQAGMSEEDIMIKCRRMVS